MPGTAILSGVGALAAMLGGDAAGSTICNTSFLSSCVLESNVSIYFTVDLDSGVTTLFSRGTSARPLLHASSIISRHVDVVVNAVGPILTTTVHNNELLSYEGPFKPQQNSSVASLARGLDKFAIGVDPASADAALHLSALRSLEASHSKLTLLPVSVAGAAVSSSHNSSVKEEERWASTVTEVLNRSGAAATTSSTTGARVVCGDEALNSVGYAIVGLTAKEAGRHRHEASSVAEKARMVYSVGWESSSPLIVNDSIFSAALHGLDCAATSSGSAMVELNNVQEPRSARAATALQMLQSSRELSRWQLQPSSLDIHGLLKVASSEKAFSASPSVLFSTFENKLPLSIPAADEHGVKLAANVLSEPRLKQQHEYTAKIDPRTPGKCAIVTGAMGGLGHLVSIWLGGSHPQNMLLLARSISPEKMQAILVSSLTNGGGSITLSQVDVAAQQEVATAVQQQSSSSSSSTGDIFHTSGTLQDSTLARQSLQGLRRVFAPKVDAAACLDRASVARPVNKMVFFSSISTLLGTSGQGNYAAANGVLDAFAESSQRKGSSCVSIQWGAWSGAGMAASSPVLLQRLRAQGYGSISPLTGLQALQRVLAASLSGAVANPFAWDKFFERFKESAAGLRRMVGYLPAEKESISSTNVMNTSSKPTTVISVESVAAEIVGLVCSIVADGPPPSLTAPLFEAGLDSIGMVELRNAMASTFNLSNLPATVFFDYPTINALASFIAEEVRVSSPDSTTTSTSSSSALPNTAELVSKLVALLKDGFEIDLPSPDTPFLEAGLDSIASVEFRQAVLDGFGIQDLPVTAIFDFPNVNALAAEIGRQQSIAHHATAAATNSFVIPHTLQTIAKHGIKMNTVVTSIASTFPEREHGEGFFSTMAGGVDTTSVIPLSKWDNETCYNPDSGSGGSSYCMFASLLAQGIAHFDSTLFRYFLPRDRVFFFLLSIFFLLGSLERILSSSIHLS